MGQSERAKAIFYAPDPATLAATAKSIGLSLGQVPDHLFASAGNTGTAMPLLVLSSALETARPGEKLLVAGYGSGGGAPPLARSAGNEGARAAGPPRGAWPPAAGDESWFFERLSQLPAR